MKAIIKTINASETAYFLRRQLGDVYDWHSRLVDWRRGRCLDYGGPVLRPLPAGYHTPFYELGEIAQFIKDYREYDRRAQANIEPRIFYMEFDTRTGAPRWVGRPSIPARADTACI